MIYKCKFKSLLRRAMKKTTTKALNELLKRIILYMTLGVDVSSLFTDMCLISQYPDTQAKKMIYLFISNYAEANPDLALLAVNTFLKDCNDTDPKIRGLVLRSLCSLKSQLSTNEVKTQVIKMLEDKSPYVQKIAVFGCVKIYYVDNNFLDEYSLYDTFYNMLRSNHPIVVASVINALNEILADEGGMAVNSKIIIYLLNRFKEFNDYGQGLLVELAMKYTPKDEEEKLRIMNLLDYKLKSSNSHLVMAITKLFLQYNICNPNLFNHVLENVEDRLITLLMSSQDELKYIVLCHIYELVNIGGAKYFEKDYKRLFCDGDDKSYVQELKLKILDRITTENSFDDVFNELSQYINEVCMSLAQESVLIMGELGKRFNNRVNAILKKFSNILIDSKSYLYDYTVISLKTIFSTGVRLDSAELIECLNHLEGLIDYVKSEKAQISFIWLLSHFYNKIENSSYLLEKFVHELENTDKSEEFKLQLINSVVYSFLKKPKEMLPILHKLFSYILSAEGENYVVTSKIKLYWTAMQNDIKVFERTFCEFFETLNIGRTERQLSIDDYKNINTLNVIYHKPAESFTKPLKYFINQRLKEAEELEANADNVEVNIEDDDDLGDTDSGPVISTPVEHKPKVNKPVVKDNDDIDFLDMDFDNETAGHDNDDDLNILDIDFSDSKPKLQPKVGMPQSVKKKIEYMADELDPADFQDQWVKTEESLEITTKLKTLIKNKETIIDTLEQYNIFCIASREDEDDVKYYFYGRRKNIKTYDLIEINIYNSKEIEIIIKCDNEDIGNEALEYIKEVLHGEGYI